MGVGAFVGAYCCGTINRLKVFGKAVAKVYVLGRDYTVVHLEYSDRTSGNYLYHKVYVKLGSSVIKNIDNEYTVCRNSEATLWDRSRTSFDRRFSYFIYVGILSFTIRARATTTGTASICMCPLTLRACVNLKPSVTLRLTDGGQVDFVVRDTLFCFYRDYPYKLQNTFIGFSSCGGIEVNTKFQYYMEPNACLQASTGSSCTLASITTCLQLHYGYPSHVNIVPWIYTVLGCMVT